MTDDSSGDGAGNLGELQRRYLEAWQHLARAGARSGNPWSEALSHWWQAAAPGATGTAGDVTARVLAQGQGFLWLADQLAGAAGGEPADPVRVLMDALGREAGDDSLRRAIHLLELPLETWRHTAASLSPLPGDPRAASGSDGGGAGSSLPGELERLLSMPALGYTREAQEGMQQLGRCRLEHQAAQREYSALFAGIGVHAVERLRRRLEEIEQRGEAITSLRQLYHLWVDCCEEAYGETVGSDDYARLYGRLINSLMAVKRRGRRLVDDSFAALGMPTRSELDTLHRRFQEERRRARYAEATLARLSEGKGNAGKGGKSNKDKKKSKQKRNKPGKAASGSKKKPEAKAGRKEKRG